jgi:hypothetical protein
MIHKQASQTNRQKAVLARPNSNSPATAEYSSVLEIRDTVTDAGAMDPTLERRRLPILPGSFMSSSIPDCPVAAVTEGGSPEGEPKSDLLDYR